MAVSAKDIIEVLEWIDENVELKVEDDSVMLLVSFAFGNVFAGVELSDKYKYVVLLSKLLAMKLTDIQGLIDLIEEQDDGKEEEG
jgi:hypothetical protein